MGFSMFNYCRVTLAESLYPKDGVCKIWKIIFPPEIPIFGFHFQVFRGPGFQGGISWNHGERSPAQSDLGLCHGRYKTLEEKLNSFSSKHSKPSHDLELGRKAWSDVWDGHPVPWHTFFGDWPGNTSRKMHGIIVM